MRGPITLAAEAGPEWLKTNRFFFLWKTPKIFRRLRCWVWPVSVDPGRPREGVESGAETGKLPFWGGGWTLNLQRLGRFPAKAWRTSGTNICDPKPKSVTSWRRQGMSRRGTAARPKRTVGRPGWGWWGPGGWRAARGPRPPRWRGGQARESGQEWLTDWRGFEMVSVKHQNRCQCKKNAEHEKKCCFMTGKQKKNNCWRLDKIPLEMAISS